ncbi:MAG TPA: lipocalin-like domain-containing protein [Mycobacterium sp.]|nr:lipocalin-like domain-containing protein [Mycobacterium sp.]
MEVDELIGTWRLRSWKNVASDGSSIDPFGEAPIGYLFYNHDGYMSVEMMAAHRAPYQAADMFGGTPEERSAAISTYLSYGSASAGTERLPAPERRKTIDRDSRGAATR